MTNKTNERTKSFSIKILPSFLEEIQEFAKNANITPSEFCRLSFRYYMDMMNNQEKEYTIMTNKSKQVTIRMPHSMIDAIDNHAKKQNKKFAEMVKIILHEWLERDSQVSDISTSTLKSMINAGMARFVLKNLISDTNDMTNNKEKPNYYFWGVYDHDE